MIDQTLKLKIENYRNDAYKYRERRHSEWNENYQLYRDKVIYNRITQRQSVNVPLMKETVRTWLANIDDAPDLSFEELNNDKTKEIFLNEYWKKCSGQNKLEIKDVVDKKQVGLYGRSFKKLNIINGEFYFEILDPIDVLIDRFADPADLDNTAQFICHQHIFRTLSSLSGNSSYDKEAVARLKEHYSSTQGMVKSSENRSSLIARNEKLRELGDTGVEDPAVGETIVELNENYIRLYDEKGEPHIQLVVTCDEEILMDKPIKDVLNIDFIPLVSWADDVERSDFWSDGIGDIVRTPNKILNTWISQLVENRTLRNFGMNFYDSTIEGFVPSTFTPAAFGWYPMPGNPNDLVKRVEIPDLSESLNEMNFIMDMAGRSTATTGALKGETEGGKVTLGEVEIVASKAMERITATAKFYRNSWKEFGEKWVKMVNANSDKLNTVKLYKKSYRGNYFEQEVSPKDWQSEAGYNVVVRTTSEQEKANMETLQKFSAIVAQFPQNIKLKEIYQKKLLDLINLSPEETAEVLDFEKQSQIPQPTEASPLDTALMEQNKALIAPVPAMGV